MMRLFGRGRERRQSPVTGLRREEVQPRGRRFLDFRPADIEQCLKDWQRNLDDVFIIYNEERKSLGTIYTDLGYSFPLTEEQLTQVWNHYLLEPAFPGVDTEAREAMLDHLKRFMHQGGYLNGLQTTLIEEAFNKGVTLFSSDFSRQFAIFATDGGIYMQETIQLNQYHDPRDIESVITIDEGRKPVMEAVSDYLLSFDNEENPEPEIKVRGINITHNSSYTRELFREFEEGLGEEMEGNIYSEEESKPTI